MLLVKACAGISQIHGIGLMAQEFIPQGACVWTLTPDFDVLLGKEQLPSLSEITQQQVRSYTYFDETRNAYVLSSDDRFTNHADNPNTRKIGDSAYAVKDIYPDEEITTDYCEWCKENGFLAS